MDQQHIATNSCGLVPGRGSPGVSNSLVFTSLLSLHHDLYYLVYFAATPGFLAAYVKTTRIDLREFFRRNWHWSLGIGAIAAAFVVFNVFSRGSTDGPTGAYLAFEVFWRGAACGAEIRTRFQSIMSASRVKEPAARLVSTPKVK